VARRAASWASRAAPQGLAGLEVLGEQLFAGLRGGLGLLGQLGAAGLAVGRGLRQAFAALAFAVDLAGDAGDGAGEGVALLFEAGEGDLRLGQLAGDDGEVFAQAGLADLHLADLLLEGRQLGADLGEFFGEAGALVAAAAEAVGQLLALAGQVVDALLQVFDLLLDAGDLLDALELGALGLEDDRLALLALVVEGGLALDDRLVGRAGRRELAVADGDLVVELADLAFLLEEGRVEAVGGAADDHAGRVDAVAVEGDDRGVDLGPQLERVGQGFDDRGLAEEGDGERAVLGGDLDEVDQAADHAGATCPCGHVREDRWIRAPGPRQEHRTALLLGLQEGDALGAGGRLGDDDALDAVAEDRREGGLEVGRGAQEVGEDAEHAELLAVLHDDLHAAGAAAVAGLDLLERLHARADFLQLAAGGVEGLVGGADALAELLLLAVELDAALAELGDAVLGEVAGLDGDLEVLLVALELDRQELGLAAHAGDALLELGEALGAGAELAGEAGLAGLQAAEVGAGAVVGVDLGAQLGGQFLVRVAEVGDGLGLALVAAGEHGLVLGGDLGELLLEGDEAAGEHVGLGAGGGDGQAQLLLLAAAVLVLGLAEADAVLEVEDLLLRAGQLLFGLGGGEAGGLAAGLVGGEGVAEGLELVLQVGAAGLEHAGGHAELELAVGGHPQVEVAELAAVALVALGLLGLAAEVAEAGLELAEHVADAQEVGLGLLDLLLGGLFLGLEAGDAGGFVEDVAAVLGLAADDAADLALLDDRVAAGAGAGAGHELLDVAEAAGDLVEQVFGGAVAEQAAGHRDLGVIEVGEGDLAAVLEGDGDLGGGAGAAGAAAGEDDVGHAGAAQVLGPLLAEAPAHGVDDVGLAAAVGADDAGDVVVDVDDLAVGERLEAADLDLLDAHRVAGAVKKAVKSPLDSTPRGGEERQFAASWARSGVMGAICRRSPRSPAGAPPVLPQRPRCRPGYRSN
jgi:hypothetical protein